MKTLFLFAAILLSTVIDVQKPAPFKSFYFLAGGSWQMRTKKGSINERWKKISATQLQSEGFRVNDKDTIMEEHVQLIDKGDSICYVPTVNNQNGGKAVSFKLVSAKNNEFIFENPAHDFPQRIVYHIIAPDSLHAWVDGKYNGKYIKQDFYYRRIK